jgi:hypothetical protein
MINSLEPHFRWLSMPGFIRAVALIHLFVFALLVLKPELYDFLAFDWTRINEGEIWRIVSFYALPPVFPSGGLYPYLGMGLAVYIAFLIGDQIEHAWGSFRTSVFSYGTILFQISTLLVICLLIAPIDAAWGSRMFYQVIFFAFATIFPRYQFRFMFAIQVPAWVLALGSALFGLTAVLTNPLYLLYALGTLFPYTFWAGPILLGYLNNRATTQVRRTKFKSKVSGANKAVFHTCISCGATDQSHPNRDFRVTPEDTELCSACLDKE